MDQTTINWVFAGFGTLIGAVLKVFWDELVKLRTADSSLVDKVARIEVLVAGDYVKRDEFAKISDAIFAKLDRIEDKLDGKVDK